MALVYGKDNPSKLRRKKERIAKREERKLKKHAKWSGLNMKNPQEAALARKTYNSLASK